MPQIGEKKRGWEIGKNYTRGGYIYHACIDCGKGRWVCRYNINQRCCSCANRIKALGRPQELNPAWKGGRVITSEGYVWIKLQPTDHFFAMANSGHYVLEHRLVMAKHLGRTLLKTETVHHKGLRYKDIKNRSDNLRDNLELRVGKHGRGITLVCADCGSRNIIPKS
ncbi:hypothetical protein LCGC14_1632930 [marine sediment metagenome]|uniref:HNH nuclease domain-containing protein n=1 Tax=marine sediment metagenome TaxID=412755 RepID=A0A0F9IPC2_9ZZZZ